MQGDWVMDVLTDMQDFAAVNGLPQLAQALTTAIVTARQELGAAPPRGHPPPTTPRLAH